MILEYTSPSFLISDHEADKTNLSTKSFWGGSLIINVNFCSSNYSTDMVSQSSTIELKLSSSDNRKPINDIKTAVIVPYQIKSFEADSLEFLELLV